MAAIRATSAQRTTLRTEAGVGSDADLPSRDRRSRAGDIKDGAGTTLVVDDNVTIASGEANVISHARGADFILLGWIERETGSVDVPAFGTFHKREVTKQ
jgi:hypothetical protein